MTDLSIIARFPLGIYKGHREDGRPDPFPTTARLHSSLTHSAGKGCTAIEDHGRLRPHALSLAALEWLEEHPPAAVCMPASWRVSRAETFAWRDEGTPTRKGTSYKTARLTSSGMAVRGAYGWLWEDVPPAVYERVAALCEDVACLGEGDCPVVLEVAPFEPTHRLTQGTELRPMGKLPIKSPQAGRTAVLEDAHRAANPTKGPSAAADRFILGRHPAPSRVMQERIGIQYYKRTVSAPSAVPWTHSLILPTRRGIPQAEVVAWCVALHRALVSRLEQAPASITGKYSSSAPKPANRVAIQYLQPVAMDRLEHGGFVLLLPSGLPAGDLDMIRTATARRIRLYRGADREIVLDEAVPGSDPANFWPEPPEGLRHSWSPVSALMPETRRQTSGRPRTLQEAAFLSVAFTFRDALEPVTAGHDRYGPLIDQVVARGVRVTRTRLIGDSRIERYAHKLPDTLVAQPYTALIDLGDLAPSRALIAIGQSRHLGGGLLQPLYSPFDPFEGGSV